MVCIASSSFRTVGGFAGRGAAVSEEAISGPWCGPATSLWKASPRNISTKVITEVLAPALEEGSIVLFFLDVSLSLTVFFSTSTNAIIRV